MVVAVYDDAVCVYVCVQSHLVGLSRILSFYLSSSFIQDSFPCVCISLRSSFSFSLVSYSPVPLFMRRSTLVRGALDACASYHLFLYYACSLSLTDHVSLLLLLLLLLSHPASTRTRARAPVVSSRNGTVKVNKKTSLTQTPHNWVTENVCHFNMLYSLYCISSFYFLYNYFNTHRPQIHFALY